MKVRQDPETGKILTELENWEMLDDFANHAQDYLDGIAEIISNNIGPDVVHLKKNQERLISICQQQQATIFSIVDLVNYLISSETAECLKHRIHTEAKLKNNLASEFNKLQRLLSDGK